MNHKEWSEEAEEIITTNSYAIAVELGNNHIGVEHFFLSILTAENNKKRIGLCTHILTTLGVDIPSLIEQIKNAIYNKNKNNNSTLLIQKNEKEELKLTRQAENILTCAQLEARKRDQYPVSTEHLMLAILSDEASIPAQMLLQEKVNRSNFDECLRAIKKKNKMRSSHQDTENTEPSEEEDREEINDKKREFVEPFHRRFFKDRDKFHTEKRNDSERNSATPMLDNFGKDLTQLALNNVLDPIIGREKELQQVIQILSRRKKNNPIIIGEPGVGKTAIVEGLAMRIASGAVPHSLHGKRIIALDLTSIVAGTQYRGQFEERLKGIMLEVEKNKEIILFIDEIHTIVGTGSASGSMDLSDILKPRLARGEFQCIGSTTLDEYRIRIEKDGALERRFQKVMLSPTSIKETLAILHKIKDKYETYHSVHYSDEAIEACVHLSDRYITNRFLPDKAIDILDEVGAKTKLTNVYPPEIIELEKSLENMRKAKIKALENKQYERSRSLRQEIQEMEMEMKDMRQQWSEELSLNKSPVDAEDVAEVVSTMTGIPLQKVSREDLERLRFIDAELKKKVIGQNKAISAICKAIRRNKIGLRDPFRPIGSFIFLGPTGVGKTALAKALAASLFDKEDALIRIDMSEYMEKFSITRLIGAPPGFIGYEEGGSLTEKVRRNPYSVVLLDEIEKAHPDIYNLLLQVLDEGVLTDSLGRKVNFKNAVIIMTSNIGMRELQDFGDGIGFSTESRKNDRKKNQDLSIQKSLKKRFSPEFLNRLDETIVFNSLQEEDLLNILELLLAAFNQRLKPLHTSISISEQAKKLLCKKGYDHIYGARPLKKVIQTEIEDRLAEVIMEHNHPRTEEQPLHCHLDVSSKQPNTFSFYVQSPKKERV